METPASVTFFDDGSGPITSSKRSAAYYSEPDSPAVTELRKLAHDRDRKWAEYQARMSHINELAGVPGYCLTPITATPDPEHYAYADRGWMQRGSLSPATPE